MDSRSRARQRPMRRQSPVRNNRRGSTSRPRMDSRSRTRPVRDSRSRSKGRGRPNRQPYRSPPRDPPVDTNPWRKPFSVTPEQRRNSVHVNGYLYATLDWSSPFAPAPWSFEPPERYNHQSRTDPSVTAWKSIPNGWEIAEAFDEVIEKVIKPHSWGTHMLIVEGTSPKAFPVADAKSRIQLLKSIDSWQESMGSSQRPCWAHSRPRMGHSIFGVGGGPQSIRL